MCQYCQGEAPLESDVMSFEVVRYQGKTPALLVNFAAADSYSDVTDLVVPINFCPMCGRSLTPLAPDASPVTVARVCEHGYKMSCPHGCL